MNPSVEETLRKFFVEQLGLSAPGDDARLRDTGFVASINLLDLVSYIETTLGVELSGTDVAPHHLESISAIARVVRARQGVT